MAGASTERVRNAAPPALDRVLSHPAAFVATAAVLLALFGSTFVSDPDRPAPADDPAYYTWRTEALLTEEPGMLLELEGPAGMLAGGYRVATPVIAGLMRRIMGVGILTPTVLLAVGLRVVVPLLLAGFAYRHRPDPLVWHGVALGSASLLLTPPFGGYLDNILTLMFLGAALFLLEPARVSWPARAAIVILLVVAGLTHPTTVAIFGVVLGVMAAARWLARGFDLRTVVRDDGPVLAAAAAAAIAILAIWKVGAWGQPAALAEAAVPPPADASFFRTRLGGWVEAMRPLLNGPPFVLAIAVLLGAGRRAAEDGLARVSILWLAPLAGVLGFVAGLSYPYYRFFNTTLAWVLLVGLGIAFAARFFIDTARRGGVALLALAGIAALGWIVATNFQSGLDRSQWNNPADAWIKPDERRELEAVRSRLEGEPARPVVFVTDTSAPEPVRVYGWLKLVANVSRFGVARGQQDRAGVYLGSTRNAVVMTPTDGEPANYRELSRDSLADARRAIRRGRGEPIFVVARSFNEEGFEAQTEVPGREPDVWIVDGGEVTTAAGEPVPEAAAVTGGAAGGGRLVAALAGFVLLMVPGLIAYRRLVPGAGTAQALGLVPALSTGLVAVAGTAVLAVTGSPLTPAAAWATLAVAAAGAAVLALTAPQQPAPQR